MSVDSRHPAYDRRALQWMRCRDVAGGTDLVKLADLRGGGGRRRYLPMLSGQTQTEYESYVDRALFYPAVERTVQGLTGLVLRKPPTVELPDRFRLDLVDLTLAGQPWESVLLDLLDDVLTVGRVGILVEFPQQNGTRPYWTLYRTEQVVNWHYGREADVTGAGRLVLDRVVLEESIEEPGTDPFQPRTVLQYRVLELVDGRYQVSLYRKQDTAGSGPAVWVMVGEPIIPIRKGRPLDAIPFLAIGPRHVSLVPDKPPLLDMVDVNLSHYRSAADLEHGRHWTGLPTPWVAGVTPGTELRIGSSVAWTFQDPNAKAAMLEFSGQGLGALEKALEHKERLMAILGARLLEGQPMRGETAEAVRLRHAGDASTLTTIVYALEEGLTAAFRWHAWWAGEDDARTVDNTIQVRLNRDFFDEPIDPAVAQTLMQMWQAGGISWETYYYLLQRGEWTRPGVAAEEERALIEAQALALAPERPAGTSAETP